MTPPADDLVAPRTIRFGPLRVEFDDTVLTPRPWTLAQSEWAAEIAGDLPPGPILELCAGAGHIGLAAAVLSDRDLVQVDANPAAVSYAVSNASRAGWRERVDVRLGLLQDAVAAGEVFPLIVADPPYLPSAEIVRWPDDPVQAIDGGDDGLDLVRACLDVAARTLAPGGQLLLQVAGPSQDRQVEQLVSTNSGWGLRRVDARIVDPARAITRIARVEAGRPQLTALREPTA